MSNEPSSKASAKKKLLFVTGTGTDVGKTYLSASLMHLALEKKFKASYFKPVQCGVDEKSRLSDAQKVEALINKQGLCHTGLFLPDPVSPHLALRKSGNTFDRLHIEEQLKELVDTHNITVLEGAGGIRVPITYDLDFLEWAQALSEEYNLVAIVCASPLLGTLNHTLMTIDNLLNAGIKVGGFTFGRPKPNFSDLELEVLLDSALFIEKKTDLPFLGVLPDMSSGINYKDWAWHPLTQWMDTI